MSAIADRSIDRDHLKLVSSQIAQLSPVQAVRLYTWAYCLAYGLHHAILTPDVSDALDEWDTREFLIDPVQTNAGSVEESILDEILPMWMVNWSIQRPFALLDDTEFPHNSFRHSFAQGGRIDLDSLFTGRVRFDRSSKSDELLQIADIAANVVYQAAKRPGAGSGEVAVYERLMNACPYGPKFGIGLTTPDQALAGAGKPNRFGPLVRAMENAYESQRRVFVG